MKVFFSASISRTQKLRPVSGDLVRILEEMGHEVLTKELVDPEWTQDPRWDKKLDADEIYRQAGMRLKDAEVLITECTVPSFGAGWWIDKALVMKKPLLSLHYGESLDNVPLMVRARAEEINLRIYTEETVRAVMERFFEELRK